jgi:stage III sporulation protein AE
MKKLILIFFLAFTLVNTVTFQSENSVLANQDSSGINGVSSGTFAPESKVNNNPGESPVETANKQMDALDLRGIETYIKSVDQEVGGYLPKLDLKQLLSDVAKGKLDLKIMDFFDGLFKYLFKEIVANSKLLGQLIILAIICAILQNVQNAFEEGTVSKIAYAVCYLVVISLAISSFTIAVNIGRETIQVMGDFMKVILPILLTLLASMGSITSAAILHPILIASISVISMVIQNIIFPLIFFSVILSIVTNISDKFEVTKLAGLLKTTSLGLLGLVLSAFLGVIVVHGIAGSVADGVTLRTAKYVTGTFVPIVGGMFSDALEAVVGASLLLKNSIGIIGVLIIFALCLFPVIKILSLVIIYKLSAAIIQPLGNGKIVECLNTMGNSLTLVFAAVASVGLMFFFVIAIVVGAGNLTTMLR